MEYLHGKGRKTTSQRRKACRRAKPATSKKSSPSLLDGTSYLDKARPPKAEGDDAVDSKIGNHLTTSALFSDDAWNPHAALMSLELPSVSADAPLNVDDDDMFLTTLFDDVLNDAEQFVAGMHIPDASPGHQAPGDPLDETLQSFDMKTSVAYVACPDVREAVRRFPSRNKQEIDGDGLVQMTAAAMARSSISGEDIEAAKEAMARMLRSFEPNPVEGRIAPCATRKEKGRNIGMTRGTKEKSGATLLPGLSGMTDVSGMTDMTDMTDMACTLPGLSPPDILPPLPKVPLDAPSPTILDTLHRPSSSNEGWLETLLTGASPFSASLCDVKLVISPAGLDPLGLPNPVL